MASNQRSLLAAPHAQTQPPRPPHHHQPARLQQRVAVPDVHLQPPLRQVARRAQPQLPRRTGLALLPQPLLCSQPLQLLGKLLWAVEGQCD